MRDRPPASTSSVTGLGPLDKKSPVPLYYQLSERLRADIVQGALLPGDLLGTEKDLAETFAVSRATVRQALDDLARSGLVERITGRGTFVATPPVTVELPNLLSFTEEMHLRGIEPGSVTVVHAIIPCPDDAAEALGCSPGEAITHTRRVRTADGVPIFVVDHFLAPFVRIEPDQMGQSLYDAIERVHGLRLSEALHTIGARACEPALAELLEIDAGDPVLRFERTTFTGGGQAVVFERGSVRADMYEYSVRLVRQ